MQTNKIRWRCCRRGMLELDTLLTHFFDQKYANLPEEEQKLFQQLLEYPDQELFNLLMGHDKPEDVQIKNLVNKIKDSSALPRNNS